MLGIVFWFATGCNNDSKSKDDLKLEKERIVLEREKLELEKQKMELEREKAAQAVSEQQARGDNQDFLSYSGTDIILKRIVVSGQVHDYKPDGRKWDAASAPTHTGQ